MPSFSPTRKTFRKKHKPEPPARFHFSLAAMFAATALAAVLVAAANATGIHGILGVGVSLWGGAIIWRSGETERFSMFLLGVLMQLVALAIAGDVFSPVVF
jgi:hypothetical protein